MTVVNCTFDILISNLVISAINYFITFVLVAIKLRQNFGSNKVT